MIIDLPSIILITIAAIYLIIAVFIVRKRGFRDSVTRLLVIYSAVSSLWVGVQAGSTNINFYLELPDTVILHIPYYFLFSLAFLFLLLTNAFLQGQGKDWRKWLFASILLGFVLTLDFNGFGLPDIIWVYPTLHFDRQSLSFFALIFGWGICEVWSTQITIKSFRKAERIVVKHRIEYWVLSLLLTFVGGLLFLLLRSVSSSILYVLGAITIYYILTAHRLPDLNLTVKRAISSLFVGLMGIIIFGGVFWAVDFYLLDIVVINPFLAGYLLAAGVLFLFSPLLLLIRKRLQKIIVGNVADTNQIFLEYSQSISNIVDLDELSSVAVGLIREVLDVKKGVLFSVDVEIVEDGDKCYRLMGAQVNNGAPIINALIPSESPIAKILGEEHLPLIQSDIDVLPQFRYLTRQERNWLNSQEMDVYFPIHFKEEWVGVFAFGPKKSGASFFDDDIELLTTLANQTAVALQNVRLESSLVRINNQYRRAYSSMEEANSMLASIDRTKSDFINIASQELRTPLTVLSGYSQILMDDPTFSEDDYYRKIFNGIYNGTSRLHEIVESMLDVAKIDMRALEFQLEPVNINLALHDIGQDFSQVLKERNLVLDFDELNELPLVQGDPEALNKVFYHLIMNAIKFTPDGGRVTISGDEISKRDSRFQSGGVEIKISDTGIGIDPRFKELIFTKFYQTGELALHSSGKTKFKGGGPGLGLAIVRGIVQAHGGRVWADSPGYDEEKKPGSHFHVLLPLDVNNYIIRQGDLDV